MEAFRSCDDVDALILPPVSGPQLKYNPAQLDQLIRRFLTVANRSGIEDIGPKIRRAFLDPPSAGIALRREIDVQLLRWVHTNPDGRHAAAIPAAKALHEYLFSQVHEAGSPVPISTPAPATVAVPRTTTPRSTPIPATRSLRLVASLAERMGPRLRPSERPRFILSGDSISLAEGVEVVRPGQVPIFRAFRDRLVVLDDDRSHPELVEKAAKDVYGDVHQNVPRIGSANSEDALTWSFLRGLAGRGPSDWATRMVRAGLDRAGNGTTVAPAGESTLALWQRHRPPASYATREGATEFDALVTLPHDLVSIEAKADSGFSTGTTFDRDRHQFLRNIDVGSHLAGRLGRTYWPVALLPEDRTVEIDFVRDLVRDPERLVRALPHRDPRELRDIASRISVATWEDLLDVAGSPSTAPNEERPLTALHRGARSPSGQGGLIDHLLTADLRALFEAERRAAPKRGDRGKSYLQDHDGIPSTGEATTRGEEHLAIALFNRYGTTSEGLVTGVAGRVRIADYQVPLKARQTDALGKVDLLGLDEEGRLCVIELKAAGSSEPPIRAVLEAFSYAAVLAANLDTLVSEFAARGMAALHLPPRVVVWAPEPYWHAHRHGVPQLAPLLDRISTTANVPVSLVSIGDVSVEHGLLGKRPRLVGTPSCRVVARSNANP